MGLPLLLGAVPSTVSRGRASSGNRDTEGACKGDKFEPRPKGEFLGGLQKCPSPAPWAPRSPVPGRDAESSKAEQRLRRSSRRSLSVANPAHILPMWLHFSPPCFPAAFFLLRTLPFLGSEAMLGVGPGSLCPPEARGPPSGQAVLPPFCAFNPRPRRCVLRCGGTAAAGQPATVDTD